MSMLWCTQAQLMQRVAAVPWGLWGFTRLNHGYKGPILQYSRQYVGAYDCWSDKDIVDLAGGAAYCNVTILYDQTGNGRHLTPNTAGPNVIYNSSGGMQKTGRQTTGNWDGDTQGGNTQLTAVGADLSYFVGSPAMSIAHALSSRYNLNGRYHFAVGGGAAPYAGLSLYFVDGTALEVQYNNTSVKKRFALAPTWPQNPPDLLYGFTLTKAAGQDLGALSLRLNGAPLSEVGGPASGAQAFGASPVLRWGASSDAAVGGTLRQCMNALLLGVWAVDLSGAPLANLEGFLLGVRQAARVS